MVLALGFNVRVMLRAWTDLESDLRSGFARKSGFKA